MPTNADLIKLAEQFAQLFRVLFSAARAFVIFKTTMFLLYFAYVGSGVYVRGSLGTQQTASTGAFELLLSEPGLPQVLVVSAVFIYAISANVYCLNKNREHELKLRELEVKAPRNLRKKLRPEAKKRGG